MNKLRKRFWLVISLLVILVFPAILHKQRQRGSRGIAESTNYFDFVAPETGYAVSVAFQMSGNEMTRRQFFLKLPTGYIRFKLQVIMGKDMFVSGDYYYNPDGSRNLEPK